jgi:hypothetical protein
MSLIPSFITQWKNAFEFKTLPVSRKEIVFYSEGKPSSPHLGPLVQELVDRGRSVQLLISDRDDPLINLSGTQIESHWIGFGAARAWTYRGLEASVFITTTPDLQTMQLKRSNNGVYYIYAHHSMISSHMGYRPGAFDYFDAIFCTGPHHVAETRAHEATQNLPAKDLVDQGYCRLDSLRISVGSDDPVGDSDGDDLGRQLVVLVAPTWGDNSIIPICGEELIGVLLDSGSRIVMRPHPETIRKSPELIRAITDRFGNHENFEFDADSTGEEWMHRSDLMISDWSGVAMEYAYGFEKPVLFIDLPRKVNNSSYEELGIEPLEVSIRSEIGGVLDVDDLTRLPEVIGELFSDDSGRVSNIKRSRDARVFNPGKSASVGADFIEKMVDEHND